MTSPNRKGTCRHCQRFVAVRCRGLWYGCANDPTIKAKYERLTPREPGMVLDKSLLKPQRPSHCKHGLKDGTCAPCEREERAAMAATAAKQAAMADETEEDLID